MPNKGKNFFPFFEIAIVLFLCWVSFSPKEFVNILMLTESPGPKRPEKDDIRN
jgi:hypothetical protein